jgi:membrane-bound lytic murein transglycosylase D
MTSRLVHAGRPGPARANCVLLPSSQTGIDEPQAAWPLARPAQALALSALALVAALALAGCASSARKADTLEAPPLLIEVPAAGAAKAGGSSRSTTNAEPLVAGAPGGPTRVTTVASLDELVAMVEPPQAGPAPSATMASPASRMSGAPATAPANASTTSSAQAGGPGAVDVATPRPMPVGASPLVPARLVERGEWPQVASAHRSEDVGTPGKAIGPLVAPPLPAASPEGAPGAANGGASDAAGGPTDPLEPGQTLSGDDPQAHTDLWERLRSGYAMPDMDGPLVRDHERWYATRPDYVQRMMDRGSRYLFHIVEEVNRRGMPSELALLPFIESAYNPQAKSVAAASGMWQFIPSTGRDFELKQNLFRDDRRDVLASTRAALDYLARLHAQFGDWRLALAAYNWGEGNVARSIARNQRARKSTRYEDISMPAETRNYLPKLQAVKNIVNGAEKFGLSLPELRNHAYFLSVPIYRDMDVAVAAQLALMDEDEFRNLNPSFDKPVILAAGTPQLLLPYDNADEFVRNLAAWQGPLASWTVWQLSHTVKPAEAARLVGVDEETLRSVNHIPPRMLIKAGSVLLVPRDDARHQDVPSRMADNAQMLLQPDGPLLRRVIYRAARNDSVAALARRYRVAPAQLAQWNKVGAEAQFAAGQQVIIYVPSATTHMARAGSRKRGHNTAHAAAGARTAKATASTRSAKGGKAAAANNGKRTIKSASAAAR